MLPTALFQRISTGRALAWVLTLLTAGCWQQPARAAGDTVVWVSLDGMRPDYLDRAPLPFFERLRKEGAWSRRLRPAFPPITFPSHCSQATGVSAERHGITGNSFYDAAARQEFRYPALASLLQAEPIWLTAQRQGIRTAVLDWPLSQAQPGPVRTEYFEPRFDNALSDDARLARLLEVWRRDPEAHPGAAPLRLLLGYVHATDAIGHQFGPDAPEITAAVQAVDRSLGEFFDHALALWRSRQSPGEESSQLVFLFTTDHGMSKIEKVVNLNKLLGLASRAAGGAPLEGAPMTVTVGNLGHVFLPAGLDAPTRAAALADLEGKLRAQPFLKAYRREKLPVEWAYRHPTRTGDLVIVLNQGYAFDSLAPAAVADSPPGHLQGMHGYPVEDDPEMFGVTFVWRSGPAPLGGQDLGEVNWDQFHPTVARLLGIRPADGAAGRPMELAGPR